MKLACNNCGRELKDTVWQEECPVCGKGEMTISLPDADSQEDEFSQTVVRNDDGWTVIIEKNSPKWFCASCGGPSHEVHYGPDGRQYEDICLDCGTIH